MLNKFLNLIYTISYLKFTQIYYQLFYRIRIISFKQNLKRPNLLPLEFKLFTENNQSLEYLGNNKFNFLNLDLEFKGEIDWNYKNHGLLWTYNLCYFNFLFQNNLSVEIKIDLIKSFSNSYNTIRYGKEPYPTSLRIINILKFISSHNINNNAIIDLVWKDVCNLKTKIEYHILANHILENCFALYFASKYFDSPQLKKSSWEMLKLQLLEQITIEGAHYEYSPMYHNLLLSRLLDCLQLAVLTNSESEVRFLSKIASKMFLWSKNIVWKNSNFPQINDSLNLNTIKNDFLLKYLIFLNVKGINENNLLVSNYLKFFSNDNYETIFKIHSFSPYYQPGHSHSDNLSVLLCVQNYEILVDPGYSTYLNNKKRILQRSTHYHNTVSIDNINSSNVWSSFRVGKRYKLVKSNYDTDISSAKICYANRSISHLRSLNYSTNKIFVSDEISVNSKSSLNWHFHPDCKVTELKNNTFLIERDNVLLEMSFSGKIFDIKIVPYQYCVDYNKEKLSLKLEIKFKFKIQTSIFIHGV
jgi:hypothetical protein